MQLKLSENEVTSLMKSYKINTMEELIFHMKKLVPVKYWSLAKFDWDLSRKNVFIDIDDSLLPSFMCFIEPKNPITTNAIKEVTHSKLKIIKTFPKTIFLISRITSLLDKLAINASKKGVRMINDSDEF